MVGSTPRAFPPRAGAGSPTQADLCGGGCAESECCCCDENSRSIAFDFADRHPLGGEGGGLYGGAAKEPAHPFGAPENIFAKFLRRFLVEAFFRVLADQQKKINA
jgi:hypothetical protein